MCMMVRRRLFSFEDDPECVDDAREKSEACEEDVDQELKSAAIREENCHGREKKGSDERQQPTSVVSPAALAFTLSSTHLGSFKF